MVLKNIGRIIRIINIKAEPTISFNLVDILVPAFFQLFFMVRLIFWCTIVIFFEVAKIIFLLKYLIKVK